MSAVHYRVEFAGPRFITVERIGDPPGWSLRVDATEGLESLLPRGYVRALDDDLVLLFTEGEHSRTGAAYHHRIHRLTREGRLLWSLRTRPLGDPVLHGGYLLVPAAPVAPRAREDEVPALQLQVRDPETGALLANFPIQAPTILRSAYRHAARALGARLSPAPHGVHVSVTAWFTGPLAPPRGAGAFDLVLDID